MDDTAKILIGAVVGFILGLSGEPIRFRTTTRLKTNEVRTALYEDLRKAECVISNFSDSELAYKIANEGEELDRWANRRDQTMWRHPLSTYLNIEHALYFIENEKAAFYRMPELEAPTFRKFYNMLASALELDEDQTPEARQAVLKMLEKAQWLVSKALDEGRLDKVLMHRQ